MSTRLTLLGRPQVEHEGRLHGMPDERRCRLLAVLALRRDWVARGELAALFWPGLRNELAAANLRKALYFARALPWAGALESQAGRLRFVVTTDVHELEAAMREGRTVDALERCRGPLLDGIDDGSNQAWTDWLDAERAQQARRWHELTRTRLTQLESEPTQAIALARSLLDADPLDEDAAVALLAAQRTLGCLDEQREAYRQFAVRLEEDLGIEPSLRVRKLLQGSAPLPPPTLAATPLFPGDGFFGRTRELEELPELLARDACRLLTVLGPGGVGKSSLMKRALHRLEPLFADGVFWIALDDLVDTAQMVARIAAELKLTPGPQQQPLALIRVFLATRRTLLVFDNAEHLADLARFARQLLDDTAQLKICVTSRSRLAAQGEWLLPLAGLALPAPHAAAADLLASDAAQMFLASAAVMRPDFDASGQAAAIGALVRATGGLPLAILLASHWVRLLPVAEIVAELEHSLDVLDVGDDEGEERPEHRSMYATFERSWQMLATREQRSLAELSVFVGTFSRHAASDIGGAALPLLAALADKSLLQMPAGGRCALHPLIRQFAAEKMDAEARAGATRRHADWFLDFLGRLGRAAQAGDPRGFDAIDTELENCRQAWRWAVANADCARLATSASALMRFFEIRGRTLEGLELLREAQAVASSGAAATPAAAAAVTAAIAHLEFRLYRLEDAEQSARRSLKFARAAGSRGALMLSLNVLGICSWQWGRIAAAKRFLDQALRHARAANDPSGTAAVLANLAGVETALGHYDAAHRSMCEALAQQRELGNWVRVANLLNNLCALHLARCEWPLARQSVDEAIALSDRHGIAQVRPHLLMNLAVLSYFCGELDEAERVTLRTLVEARSMANPAVETQAQLHLVRIAVRRGNSAAAREQLATAIGCAAKMGYALIQLDIVLAFATLLAVEGNALAAAPLLRYVLAQPNLQPADTATAHAALDSLPPAALDCTPPRLDLDELVQRIAAQVHSA